VSACRSLPHRAGDEACNLMLGTQTIGVKYGFTDQTRLVETASRIREMGSGILKISLEPRYPEQYGMPAHEGVESLTDLVTLEPSFRHVFGMDFHTYFLWCYPFRGGTWAREMDADAERREYGEMYAFCSHLLTEYRNSGKRFFLGHWEGDWYLHPGYDPKKTPTDEAFAGMIKWLNVRQRAIDDAKREVGCHGVELYGYAEVNLVQKALEGGRCLTTDVLPHTNVDYVSYSAYDSLGPRDLDGLRRSLHAALDCIEEHLPEKPGLPPGRRVLIGEYGYPLTTVSSPDEQARLALQFSRVALEWGCPYVLYWEFYCNEINDQGHRGFWLINDRDQPQPLYHQLQAYYGDARLFVERVQKRSGRLPPPEALRRFALAWLENVSRQP
jgi:hypothetical protein